MEQVFTTTTSLYDTLLQKMDREIARTLTDYITVSVNEKFNASKEDFVTKDFLRAELSQHSERMMKAINGVSESINERINGVSESINGVSLSINERINGVSESINGVSLSINERINGVSESINGVSLSINERINEVSLSINERINEVSVQFQKDLNNTMLKTIFAILIPIILLFLGVYLKK